MEGTSLKLYKRGGLAAIAIAGAALVAAGCGSGGGSGASAAAKDAKILDLVPKDAIGYATVDTDFSGDNWKQFDHLATAFDSSFKGVKSEIDKAAEQDDSGTKVDYSKDVDPWLGDSAGAAILSVDTSGDNAKVFAWVENDDTAKFEKFAKDQKLKQGAKIGDYKTFDDPKDDTTHLAYNDDYILIAETRAVLKSVTSYDGDSITDADGVSDAVDGVDGDALATFVLSGDGARKALKSLPQYKSVAGDKRLQDFKSLAVSLSAEDKGMQLSGFAGADGSDAPKNTDHSVFGDLPSTTVFAVGGSNFGGGLKQVAEAAGKQSPQVQQALGAGSAALGVSIDDIAKNLDGDFAIGMGADDAGLGSLAGGVAGAAMGGGLSGVDPAALAKAASLTLSFEETGDTSKTIDKLAGAVGGLTGATGAPKTGTAGDFSTKTMSVAGYPVTTASSKDVAALSLGAPVFDTWGKDPLSKSDAFSSAWDAADAPDSNVGELWLDAGRIAKLAGVKGASDVELGGLVGWIESDGSNAKFGMFLHIEDK
jgi:hypothetical protein